MPLTSPRWLSFALLTFLVMAGSSLGGTLYVDDDKVHYVSSWGTGGLPVQPMHEWRLADGLDYDTVGAAGYRNYGDTEPAGALINGSAPGLTEGVLSKWQSALEFDGVNDYLINTNTAVMAPGEDDFALFVWFRTTTPYDRDLVARWNNNNLTNNAFQLRIGNKDIPPYNGEVGRMCAIISGDGSRDEHIKTKGTLATYNDGKWHLGGMVWQSDSLILYVDGSAPTQSYGLYDASVTSVYASTLNLEIGRGDQPNRLLNGDIAWVAYWQGANIPDGSEVSALYAAMSPTGVDGDEFPTIQSAIHQSSSGDILAIRGGIYRETVVGGGNSLTFTAADSSFGNRPVLLGDAFGSVNGFVITAASTVSYLTIRGYGSQGLRFAPSSPLRFIVSHCEFDSNSTNLNISGGGGVSDFEIVNSIFDRRLSGVTVTSGVDSVYLINNIFTNLTYGIQRAAGTVVYSYCDFYNNGTNKSGSCVDGGGNQALDPRYRGGNDYRPLARSLLLRLGNTEVARYMGAWDIGYVPVISGGKSWARGAWGR